MILTDSKVNPDMSRSSGSGDNLKELPPVPSERSDSPPPYSAGAVQRPANSEAEGDIEPVVAPTNNLVVHNRRMPIEGVFRINPEYTPSYVPEYLRKKNRRCGKSRPTLNASFYTRHAPIALDLGIVSTSHENMVSHVEVENRSGDVSINLSLEAPKHIDLNVYSRKGNIIVFLPKNFFGAVKVYSRHGQVLFLPALSRTMRIAKKKDREAMIFVGQASFTDPDQIEDNSTKHADFCQLWSKSGDVVVGLSGEDTYTREETNFWRKLGHYLRGDASVEHSA